MSKQNRGKKHFWTRGIKMLRIETEQFVAAGEFRSPKRIAHLASTVTKELPSLLDVEGDALV
eukprot:351551-Amphidinium_carterae.1